jgi:hypothetical protein
MESADLLVTSRDFHSNGHDISIWYVRFLAALLTFHRAILGNTVAGNAGRGVNDQTPREAILFPFSNDGRIKREQLGTCLSMGEVVVLALLTSSPSASLSLTPSRWDNSGSGGDSRVGWLRSEQANQSTALGNIGGAALAAVTTSFWLHFD